MNRLSVRRVLFQNLNEDGTPDGKPTYGVIAADSDEARYNNTFFSIEELNKEINIRGCILELIEESDAFLGIDRSEIGTDNFYGRVKLKGGGDED